MHGVCHCTNCKRRTGSAFGISAYFDRTAVVQRRGETKTYTFHHTAQNHDQERHFCSHCGTTLFWFVSSVPEKIGIAGGCFADAGLPEPSYSVTDWNRES
ncbi:MAG: GFA family protein [Burkholderiales bacterium]